MQRGSSGRRTYRSRRAFQAYRPYTSRGHYQRATASTSTYGPYGRMVVRPPIQIDHGLDQSYSACVLCRATSYCRQLCQRDGNLLHVPCCLHGMKLASEWSDSPAERLQSLTLPSEIGQEHQRYRPTANSPGSIIIRREFVVHPLEYVPEAVQEVVIGEVFQDDVPPQNSFFREDSPE